MLLKLRTLRGQAFEGLNVTAVFWAIKKRRLVGAEANFYLTTISIPHFGSFVKAAGVVRRWKAGLRGGELGGVEIKSRDLGSDRGYRVRLIGVRALFRFG